MAVYYVKSTWINKSEFPILFAKNILPELWHKSAQASQFFVGFAKSKIPLANQYQ